jgi:hypothetical protein
LELKSSAPIRAVTEVGIGDFIKTADGWSRITRLHIEGRENPLTWRAYTAEGGTYRMYEALRYAKAQDILLSEAA